MADAKLVALKTNRCGQVEAYCPQALEAVIVEGPLSLCIDADSFALQYYKNGIIKKDCCEEIDHRVLAFG